MVENGSQSPLCKAINEFVENVGISGLQEAFQAPFKVIRIMFKISLLLAFGAIGYEMYSIITQYTDQSDIFSTLNIINDRPPFPAVTICYPETFNGTFWDEATGQIYENDKAVRAYMKKKNLQPIDVTNFLLKFMAQNASIQDAGRPEYKATTMVLNKLVEVGIIFWQLFSIPCDQAMSNCSMNGDQFDCCQESRVMFKQPSGTCYHIPSPNITKTSENAQILSLNVSTDWKYGKFANGIASDGFEVYIHILPFFLKVLPIFIPAGMDATVVAAEPKRIDQIEDCIQNDQAPKLNYFDQYDTEGVQCVQEAILEAFSRYLGCVFASGFFIPEELNCTVEAVFFGLVAVTMDFEADASMTAAMKALEEKVFGAFRTLTSHKSPCKPLCTRWAYPAISTSYASVVDRNMKDETETSNISWSTIKIILPYTSYMNEGEQKRARWYLAVCEIGGMMGVYAGFSVITFAEIAFYGLVIIFAKRMRAVHPTVEPVALAAVIAQEDTIVTTEL